MSQPPRNHRGQRERNGGGGERESRDPRTRREHHDNKPPSSARSSSQPPYYPRESPSRRAPREEDHGSKCTHICSRRGIVLICAVLTNALVLICVVAAYMTLSGFSASGGLSGGNILGSSFPFEGVELQQVRELDMQFGQMRAPGVYGGLCFSLVMGILSLLFVVTGNKPAYLLPRKILYGQFFFLLLGSVVYVVAVGLYLHFVISVNATDVCKRRERLYARNGYTWMNCEVGGADAAVALFALITVILYIVGAVFTFQTIRGVRQYEKERRRHEQGGRPRPNRAQNAPLQADEYV